MKTADRERTLPFSFEHNQFKTINTRDAPVTVKEDECPILENFMPIGTSLYTVPGVSAILQKAGEDESVWTANTVTAIDTVRIPTAYNGYVYKCTARSGTFKTHATTEPIWPTSGTIVDNEVTWTAYSLDIIRMFDFNDEGTNKKILATKGGAIYSSTDAYVQTRLCLPGITTNPKFRQWSYTNLLILDPTAGYATWDGAAAPPLSFNASYKGTAIAIFATRVWIANTVTSARTIQYTSPLGFLATDFVATGSGSVIDAFASLRMKIVALEATQEYLYVIGDHATHLIHGVQLLDTGSTAFQIVDALPGVGSIHEDSVLAYGSSVFFVGDSGVWAVQGMQNELLSSYLDGLFPNFIVDLSVFSVKACIAKIYNKNCYCMAVKHYDLIDGSIVKTLWVLYEGRWFNVKFGATYDIIAVQSKNTETESSCFAAYGPNVVQIFTGTSIMTRRVKTKAENHGYPINDKQVLSVGGMISNDTGLLSPLVATITAQGETSKGSAQVTFTPSTLSWYNNAGLLVTWTGMTWGYPFNDMFGSQECDGRGKRISLEYIETSVSEYVLTGLMLEGMLGARG